MKNTLTFLALFLSFGIIAQEDTQTQTQTQNPCNCCEAQYLDFDFWIGEWEVFDTSGTQVGTSLIKQKIKHCIIEENWTGGSGFTGSSYNFYNKQDSTWNQIWIDNTGGILNMKGGLKDGKMVMQTEPIRGREGFMIFNRITWTPFEDGSVTQAWEVIHLDDESIVQLAFYGIYRKKE